MSFPIIVFSSPQISQRNGPMQEQGKQPPRMPQFSLASILISMTVFATIAMTLAHWWQAVQGGSEQIGVFVIVTAMSPLLLLLLAGLVFRLIKMFSE